MLHRVEGGRTELARRYEIPDIQATMIVAWDEELSLRHATIAPAVRPLRSSDTAADLAGVTRDALMGPLYRERPATAPAGEIVCSGHAWVASSGEIRGGEEAVPGYLDGATPGDELGVDFRTGRARRRQEGDALLGHAVYVTKDGATTLVRLALAFAPPPHARQAPSLDARAPLR